MTKWQLTSDPAWVLRQVGFDPSQEREMESLFSIGNGYVGVRGATDFLIPSSQGDLFISGVFDRKVKSNPYSEPEFITTEERENRYSEIVPFPFPFRVGGCLDGEPLKLLSLALANHTRILDFKQGIYFEHYTFKDAKNRVLHFQSFRCASLADPHLLLQQIEIFSENYAGPVSVEISMRPEELELAYPHIELYDNLNSEKLRVVAEVAVYKTRASQILTCFASRVSIDQVEKDEIFHLIAIAPGRRIQIRKIVSVFSTEDQNFDQLVTQATTHIGANMWDQFDLSMGEHVGEWQEFWGNASIELYD